MKMWIVAVLLIIILAIVLFAVIESSPEPTLAITECTLEAKLCPDGTSVGRTGPNCEFASCPAEIANPASTNCIEKGGTLRIVDSPQGQYGMCKLPSGVECEEWALFRGECP